MGLLPWMGALGVIIKLLPSLVANGYGVCELYRYVVAFGFVFYIGIVFRYFSLIHVRIYLVDAGGASILTLQMTCLNLT